MQHMTVRLHLFYLLLFLHPLASVDLEEMDKVPVEVIVDTSPCSTTCGLGLRTQTLCLLKDGETAMEEVREKEGTEVSEECRVRKVKCLESWQCGLRTMTVTSGQRVEMDCLGEVMKTTGRFSWRVSWRYARGIISSDDSLFTRWDAPLLDRVILDPVTEEDAGKHAYSMHMLAQNFGTYRCVVQDATFHRVKRAYWGIRVLPAGFLNLDYESSLAQWDSTGNQQNQTVSDQHDHRVALLYTSAPAVRLICLNTQVVIGVSLAGVGAGLMLLGLYRTVRRRELSVSTHVAVFTSRE